MELVVRQREASAHPVEMVERKGLGHPDTICDALAEELSRALSRFYLERFGAIQHHNVDKVLLWAGRSRPRLGGGTLEAPIEIFLAGRATTRLGGVDVPVADLAHAACEAWIERHLRYVDPRRDVRLHCLVRPGSSELVELFAGGPRSGRLPSARPWSARLPSARPWSARLPSARWHAALANDTSLGVGFAPLTPLEAAVLAAERALNSEGTRRAHPALGEDVKVLGVRRGATAALTVACAMVDRHLPDVSAYLAAREAAARCAGCAAQPAFGRDVTVVVNAADDPARERLYLTVTGTSAESGDDGQAGRGNRANGLITPYRPMTLESIAGKNPVSHVGKLYNVAAQQIAQSLVAAIPELAAAEVYLASRIGQSVTAPALVDVALTPREGDVSALAPRAEALVRDAIGRIDELWHDLVARGLEL
jgi:S-adenosylmethionine synthetase